MNTVGSQKKRSNSSFKYERPLPLAVAELRPWGVPKYQVAAFADVSLLLIIQTPLHTLRCRVCLFKIPRPPCEAAAWLVASNL